MKNAVDHFGDWPKQSDTHQGYKLSSLFAKAEEPTEWTTAEDAALWGVKDLSSTSNNAMIYTPDGCTIRTYAHFMDWVAFAKMELEEKEKKRREESE